MCRSCMTTFLLTERRVCSIVLCTVQDPTSASKDEFVRVDVEYARSFARICKAAGVKHFSLVTRAVVLPQCQRRPLD